MAKRVIRFELSDAGIEHAISEINRFKGDFLRTCNEVIQKLVDMGVMYAKAQITSMHAIESGELLGSIKGYFHAGKRTGIIYSDCWYAIFVEYGTGIVGRNSPHPDPPASWAYDVNEHGDAGWFYYDRNLRPRWTKGQASGRFLYEAKKYVRNNAPNQYSLLFGKM